MNDLLEKEIERIAEKYLVVATTQQPMPLEVIPVIQVATKLALSELAEFVIQQAAEVAKKHAGASHTERYNAACENIAAAILSLLSRIICTDSALSS